MHCCNSKLRPNGCFIQEVVENAPEYDAPCSHGERSRRLVPGAQGQACSCAHLARLLQTLPVVM